MQLIKFMQIAAKKYFLSLARSVFIHSMVERWLVGSPLSEVHKFYSYSTSECISSCYLDWCSLFPFCFRFALSLHIDNSNVTAIRPGMIIALRSLTSMSNIYRKKKHQQHRSCEIFIGDLKSVAVNTYMQK